MLYASHCMHRLKKKKKQQQLLSNSLNFKYIIKKHSHLIYNFLSELEFY